MTSMAQERLQTERKNWRKDHPPNFIAKPVSKPDGTTDLFTWNCSFPGKENTDWAGGVYKVKLQFPPDFPLNPPIATFTQPLYHPNVFEGGQVCLSILKAHKDWAASISVKEILIGLQDLLTTPNPNDPANSRAAAMYMNQPKQYQKKCKEMAERCKPEDDDAE